MVYDIKDLDERLLKEYSGMGRRRFLKLFGLGLGASALTFYLGSNLSGCSGARLIRLKNSCPEPGNLGNRLRVASYNIANARGNTDEFFLDVPKKEVIRNLEEIIEMFRKEDVDVACMNEVDFDSLRTKNIDQAKYIARGLCFNYVLEETMFGLPPFYKLGNAVVSRYPLKLNGHSQYGASMSQRIRHIFKSYVDFDVFSGDRELNLVLTHYDAESPSVRNQETSKLIKHLSRKRDEFVLLGDFNSGPGDSCFDPLIDSGIVHNSSLGLLTYPSDTPRRGIDHILVSSGLSVGRYYSIPMTPSDHRPVIADVVIG